MTDPNFQTVRLGKGKHRSPADGACVVELASMIADEPFSDHPQSVCPVIAAFLRAYNDAVPPRRRRDLYACASVVVGTRSTPAVERARLTHCLSVLDELPARTLPVRLYAPSPARLRSLLSDGPSTTRPLGAFTDGLARALRWHGRRGHARALALVDELVAITVVPAEVADAPAGELQRAP